ncbi:MAG TPA: hypothetical protein VH639_05180 [Bryobacteraceae bacterium]
MRKPLFHITLCGGVAGIILYLAPAPAGGQSNPQTETASNDAVSHLERRLENGEAALDYNSRLGYLPSLLKLLDVNADSQVLVFSKTSFQQALISPKNPRAIFFNDDVSIGAVPGGEVFEISAVDPVRGVAFYTLNMHQSDRPRIERRTSVCGECHDPVSVLVPGLMVTSVIPDANGTPFFTGAFFNITDHRTPIGQRWGGWYVTGSSEPHLGNAVAPDPNHPTELETKGTQNLLSLAGKFDLSNYPVPTSDIVALMTLEHQTRMITLMTSISAQARSLLQKGKLDEAVNRKLDQAVEEIVASLLFADEAPLHESVKGVSTFTQTFPQRGPRDKQGRSLRDFDLKTRMFRYPLSYMVYSPTFDNMPDTVRERIYRRLDEVLTGEDKSAKYARISAEDRGAALDILRQTKPNLPDYFK